MNFVNNQVFPHYEVRIFKMIKLTVTELLLQNILFFIKPKRNLFFPHLKAPSLKATQIYNGGNINFEIIKKSPFSAKKEMHYISIKKTNSPTQLKFQHAFPLNYKFLVLLTLF